MYISVVKLAVSDVDRAAGFAGPRRSERELILACG